MAKKSLTVTLHITGMREALAAFRKLPKEANDELRAQALKLSELLARSARREAQADSPQAALLAPTIKARKDRVPAVSVGGTVKLGSRRTPAYKILMGAEFGSHQFKQFRPHLGKQGYWFFPTVEREEPAIAKAWLDAADTIIEKFSRGG